MLLHVEFDAASSYYDCQFSIFNSGYIFAALLKKDYQ